MRIVVRVVRRRDLGSRPAGRELDLPATTQRHLGEVQPEAGRRLAVGVGNKPNGQPSAGGDWNGRRLISAESTKARRTRTRTVEYLPPNIQ